jgi:hypothetical protein
MCIICEMKIFFLLVNIFRKSAIIFYVKVIYRRMPVFLLTFCYFLTLYFVGSNLSFLIITLVFFLVLYIVLRDVKQAIFLVFIASLPFARGKSYDIVLIPKEQIPVVGLFDVGYYFPFYPSVVFLVGTLYIVFRKLDRRLLVPRQYMVQCGYILFLSIGCIPVLYSPFPVVVALSIVQLILMGCIYLLPHWLRMSIQIIRQISHILAAFVIFESAWVVAQVFHGGPLGRYIEAILPLNRMGILSTEDIGLMRFNGTFYEPSILGTFMLMHVFYFFLLIMRKLYVTRLERNIYIIALLSALVALVFTGSRGIYGLFGIMLFLLIRTHIKIFVKTITRTPLTRIIILIGLTVTLIVSSYVIKRVQTIPLLFSGYGSGSYRVQLNTMAFKLATAHPFGVGLNLSPYYFSQEFIQERTNDPAHPHNIFFQIAAETGLVGIIAFLLFLWCVYRPYIRQHSVRSEPFFVASVIFLLAAQFYPIFISQPEILSFFFLHLGFMNYPFQKHNNER